MLNKKHTSGFAVANINLARNFGNAARIKQAGKGASPIDAVAGVWHPPFLEIAK